MGGQGQRRLHLSAVMLREDRTVEKNPPFSVLRLLLAFLNTSPGHNIACSLHDLKSKNLYKHMHRSVSKRGTFQNRKIHDDHTNFYHHLHSSER